MYEARAKFNAMNIWNTDSEVCSYTGNLFVEQK